MDAEYVEPLVVEGQIDEEHLVEAPLADHLCGQEVYAVGGGAHEQPARLLLHPRQEEAEDAAQLAFLGLRVDPGLDLVEPDHCRRHRLEHVAGVREGAFGRPVTSGEDRDHVDAIERQLEAGRDRLDGQTLAAARDAHDQHPFGHDLGADAVSHLEQLAPLHQPLLHERQSADVLDAGLDGEVLDHAGAVHQHALLFEERRNRFLIQDRARAERATNRMARLVERQALKGPSELEEGGLVGIEAAAGGRDHRCLAPQKADQLVEVGNRELDVDDGALDLLGDELDRRADDQELATIEAEVVQVAQPPPDVRRRLRDLYDLCFDRGKFLIICSPVKFIPEEIERAIVYVELAVPDLDELVGFLRREATVIAASGGSLDADEATLFQLGRALQGLTFDETRHAIRRALGSRPVLDQESVPALLEEKRMLVNRTGMIEYLSAETGIEHVGGLQLMKKWLMERRKLFQMRDRISAEIVPKGVLVMGISGCGKSLSIKAIASCFELPLYRIDMVAIFSGRHGTPEGAFAHACHMLESMAPAVVWFDEIEAGINTQAKEGELGRIFGFFLTWMQEKARGLFVGATANRIDLLPAEMIRKGRFDEVFFVDLPTDEERLEIFKIHLSRRGVDASGIDLNQLTEFTKGWTGAEIEQCVVSALTTARLQERALQYEDLFNATANVVPLSKTMKEQVDHIRKWAFHRAVRASPRER